MECLVIYVPTDAAQAVRQAIGGAGAGRLGNTRTARSASQAPGAPRRCPACEPGNRGRRNPRASPRNPSSLYPRSWRNAVVAAAISAHPYETPAFMTFPVDVSLPGRAVHLHRPLRDNDGLHVYEVHGPAASGRPPLLLIPGGITIGTNFSELIPLLVGHCQVIAVEEEGHGHTQPTDRPLTAENSAGDILAVLDQLNVDTVDALGFSAGGHRRRACPRRPAVVRRLIAASTSASRDAVPDEFWTPWRRQPSPTCRTPPGRRPPPEPGTWPSGAALRTGPPAHPGPRRMARRRAGHHHRSHPGGERDRDVVTAGYAARIAGAIPGSRLLIVPGGHGDYLGERPPAAGTWGRCMPPSRSCSGSSASSGANKTPGTSGLPATTTFEVAGTAPFRPNFRRTRRFPRLGVASAAIYGNAACRNGPAREPVATGVRGQRLPVRYPPAGYWR